MWCRNWVIQNSSFWALRDVSKVNSEQIHSITRRPPECSSSSPAPSLGCSYHQLQLHNMNKQLFGTYTSNWRSNNKHPATRPPTPQLLLCNNRTGPASGWGVFSGLIRPCGRTIKTCSPDKQGTRWSSQLRSEQQCRSKKHMSKVWAKLWAQKAEREEKKTSEQTWTSRRRFWSVQTASDASLHFTTSTTHSELSAKILLTRKDYFKILHLCCVLEVFHIKVKGEDHLI